MNLFSRLTHRFSNRAKALALYKRGMAKAKDHDYRGAIEDYTKAISMPQAPADVKAMVLYNRALVYVTAGDERKGVDDLGAVLVMDQAPAKVRAMARQKLARREASSRVQQKV